MESKRDEPSSTRGPDTRGRWRRRAVLGGLASAAVAVGLATHRLFRPAHAGDELTELPAWLREALQPGTAIDRWHVVTAHPIRQGAIAVVLATPDDHRFQVDILARDAEGPSGVANTERLSLFVHNRGNGSTPTDEAEGLGALALSRHLAAHEDRQPLPDLLTMAQRARRFPSGAFDVPLDG